MPTFVAVKISPKTGLPECFPARGGETNLNGKDRNWVRLSRAHSSLFSTAVMNNTLLVPGAYAVYVYKNGEYQYKYQLGVGGQDGD